MNIDNLKIEIQDILNKVADQLNLKHYDVEFIIESDKGNGFLGEFFIGSIIDKEVNKTYYIAIKKAVPEDAHIRKFLDIADMYRVENLFYTDIFPAFDKLQRNAGIKDPFEVAKHYLAISDIGHEAVVMENILHSGYKLHDKRIPLDEEKIKFIFKEYGKFHALSFAFKSQNQEEYEKLTVQLPPIFSFIINSKESLGTVLAVCDKVFRSLDPEKHAHIIEKFEPYKINGDMFCNAYKYDGDFGTILHGDCWSNNMMFKYDENGKLESLRMLDFQICSVGTPAYDLSYFFYAGASKKDFYKLEEYLDVYYESFSSFANQLNCDPNKLYPKEQLILDWKKYGKAGLMMALNIQGLKKIDKEEVGQLATRKNETDYSNKNFNNPSDICTASIDILEHAYDYGVL